MVAQRNTVIRSMHDVGLAVWFGGSLMGAVGLNGAAEQAGTQTGTAQLSGEGWKRWAPVNAAAIGVHLLGGAGILVANRKRAAAQKGVAGNTVAKLTLTAAALAATGYTRVLGKKIETDVARGPAATDRLPGDAEAAQRQMHLLQWSVPILTGVLEVLNAQQGEQQRPGDQLRGIAERAGGLVGIG